MTFSILDKVPNVERPSKTAMPAFFADLNLDQVTGAILKGKEEYDLAPLFFSPLRDVEAVRYRHDVFRDFENPEVIEPVRAFSAHLSQMRKHLATAEKIRYPHEADAWFLESVDMYCDAIANLREALSAGKPSSAGFSAFQRYLDGYIDSPQFRRLISDKERVRRALEAIEYLLIIRDNGFTVRRYDSEPDYSVEVESSFDKFKQGAVKDYRVRFRRTFEEMDHIEAQVLSFVAKLHPAEFQELRTFRSDHSSYADEAIVRFDREAQFYIAYLDYIAPLRCAGLEFCYPDLALDDDKNLHGNQGFDIALAQKLISNEMPVVCNDFFLHDEERIIVVSGPNQGGKTTFARAFGQLHYLAALGCPVPGTDARLYLFDRLFTQFEREEAIQNLRSKLEDDLVRLREILDAASSSSIIVLNEIFTSTTIADAVFLSRRIMDRLLSKGVVSVWVTFIDELASCGPQTVSMVSTVVPDNPAVRTFRVVRKPADGLAYALAIAERHRVTHKALQDRIPS